MKRIAIYIISIVCVLPVVAQNQSLTIDDCRRMALENNTKIKKQRMSLEDASLQKKEAFTHMFPSISATGMTFRAKDEMIQMELPMESITPVVTAMGLGEMLAGMNLGDEVAMMKDGTFASVMATWPIFAGGQIYNANRLAKLGYEVSELQLKQTELEIKLTAEQYYWQVISLEAKLQTIQTMQELLKRLESEVQVAVDAGVATRNDLLQVQLQQGQVESGMVTLQSNYAICKMLLSQYIGLGLDTSITLQVDSASSLTDMTQEIPAPEEVLVTATDVVGSTLESELMQQSVMAKKLQYQMEIGKHLPTVALGGTYFYHDMMGDDGTTNGMIFATVSVPITDWWGGSYAIKREKNAYKSAEMDFQDVQQQLLIGIQVAETNLRDAWQQVNIAKRTIEQSDENLRLQQDFYSAGTSTMSDLLQAQSLSQQNHDKYVDSWTQYQIKRLEYLHATGRYE